MSPSIDFTQVKSLEPIPSDKYLAEITHAETGTSQKGNVKIAITWTVIGGAFDGRKVYDNMTFTPDSAWRAKQTLQALGWSKDFVGDIEAEELIGLQAYIAVGLDEQHGVDESGDEYPPRNKVLKVKPASTAAKGVKDLK
jgi:hypothetical protein